MIIRRGNAAKPVADELKHVTAWALDYRGKYAGKIVCDWTKSGLVVKDLSIQAGPLPVLHATTERDLKLFLESIGYGIQDML